MKKLLIPILLTMSWLVACSTRNSSEANSDHELPDTLRVGTLYGPSSYFIYRDEPMGYDYEMARKFAESHGMQFRLVVAGNISRLVEMLDSGIVDLAAFDVPRTAEYNTRVLHCGQVIVNWQVLVQMKGDSMISDVTQLVDKKITVEDQSRFYHRLKNLNEELGGGILIDTLRRDTIVREDLIEMVHRGECRFTVVDSETAAMSAPYYPDLDMGLKVSLEQVSSWCVAPGNRALADAVDEWWGDQERSEESAELYRHYFDSRKELFDDGGVMNAPILGNGRISRYDDLFRQSASIPGWDWRLLAALGWTESHFIPDIRSWAGACGIMQLMPRTAANFGLKGNDIFVPSKNIEVGAKLLKLYEESFADIRDEAQRRKFVLASYNSGLGHILDARALARKYGYNPNVWEGNVRTCVLMKSKAEYYNDPVVRHGYFNSKETVGFVDKVERLYLRYRQVAE